MAESQVFAAERDVKLIIQCINIFLILGPISSIYLFVPCTKYNTLPVPTSFLMLARMDLDCWICTP
jgi:hypothetical protein